MKSRFIYIILSIMLVILVSPYIRPTGKTGHIFTTLLAALIPLTSVYALTKSIWFQITGDCFKHFLV